MKRTALFPIAIWCCFVLTVGVEAQQQKKQSPRPGSDSTSTQRDKTGERYVNEESDSFPCKQTLCTDCPKLNDPASDTFRITGILLKKDGSPLEGKTVYVYLLNKGDCIAFMGIAPNGTVDILPHASSDAKGRFTTKMLRYGEITEFTIGFRSDFGEALRLGKPQRNIPVRQGGDVLKIKVEKGTKEVDLGEIIVK